MGTSTSDDAGVFRIAPDQALVQTVDFFTPIVDDAYDWGRITAANALSDIYAMGASPLTALQMIGWPRDELPFELLGDVLRGGADVMVQAGCVITGGHSIDDREPKYGFAVTGTVHPDRIVTNAGAKPGDRLVITKPLGTGIAATAIKAGQCPEPVRAAVTDSMVALNAAAAAAMVEIGVNARPRRTPEGGAHRIWAVSGDPQRDTPGVRGCQGTVGCRALPGRLGSEPGVHRSACARRGRPRHPSALG